MCLQLTGKELPLDRQLSLATRLYLVIHFLLVLGLYFKVKTVGLPPPPFGVALKLKSSLRFNTVLLQGAMCIHYLCRVYFLLLSYVRTHSSKTEGLQAVLWFAKKAALLSTRACLAQGYFLIVFSPPSTCMSVRSRRCTALGLCGNGHIVSSFCLLAPHVNMCTYLFSLVDSPKPASVC